MNPYYGKPLSASELVDKLNEGGWFVTGGRNARDFGFSPKLAVIKTALDGETLKVETAERSFEAPAGNIASSDPWAIGILQTFTRQEQRKKIEGGGWREVPFVGAALLVGNPTLEVAVKKEREEQAKREKEEKERKAVEELNARRNNFIANLTAGFVGKTLVEVAVTGEYHQGLQFEFDDGSVITIGSDIGDCCGYNCGSAVVNGVSLDTFKRQSR